MAAGPCSARESQDGSRVVFPFQEELVPGARRRQIYEWDGGKLRALIPGKPAIRDSVELDEVSVDATHMFVSTSASLSPEDVDGSGWDVYDISGGVARLVSTGPLDAQSGGALNLFAGASPDGSRAFFDSFAKLTADDLDQCPDLYQRSAGVTTLVGPNHDPPPFPLCEEARFGGVSRDGSHFFFVSEVELEPGDEQGDDLYQQVGSTLARLTTYPEPDWNCVEFVRFADASSDGGTVLFITNSAVSPEDTDRAADVYKRRPDGTFVLVSRDTPSGEGCGFPDVRGLALSADGRTAIFETHAQLSPADHDSANDIYSADDSGAIELISTGPTDPGVEEPTNIYPDWIADVSDDAKRVAFETRQRLVPGDRDEKADVYVRMEGQTMLVSRTSSSKAVGSNAELGGISGDGSTVVFETKDPLVAKDSNGERDVYLWRLGSRHVVLLSAETIAPHVSVSRRAARLRSGALAVRVGCPKAERDGPCHGVVKLAMSHHGRPLGRETFRIGVGKRSRIAINLHRSLSHARHLVARVRGIDSMGNEALVVRRVALGRG